MRFATFCVGWTFHLYWKCWKLRKLVHSTRTSRGNRCASVMVYLWTRTIVLHISSFFGVAFVFIRNIYIYICIYIYTSSDIMAASNFQFLQSSWIKCLFGLPLHWGTYNPAESAIHAHIHQFTISFGYQHTNGGTEHYSIVSVGLSMSIDWYVELCACVRMCINERTFTTHIQMSNNPA